MPKNGKTGYLTYATYEHPLYRWGYSGAVAFKSFVSSSGQNNTRRVSGLVTNTVTLAGVEFIPRLITDFLANFTPQTFEVGIINEALTQREFITVNGVPSGIELYYRYTQGAAPSFEWRATYEVSNAIVFQTRPMGTPSEIVTCQNLDACSRDVFTSDFSLNSGSVLGVTEATLKWAFTNPSVYLSNNIPYREPRVGPMDTSVSMRVQEDLQYWVNTLNREDPPHDYIFPYGSGSGEQWLMRALRPEAISDVNVNVATGEILSLSVELQHG